MELIGENQPVLPLNQTGEMSCKDAKRKGKVVQKNYVMNDLGALRKKLKHEGRKKEYILAKEGKDGCNAVIQMKASFFDFTKAKFIEEIQASQDIDDVKNALAAKAGTDGSGEAYVEYSMDIVFRAKDNVHTVKLTAYTTTCQLMIQPVGEQSGIKLNLGSRGTPMYFVDTFLFPWCEKAVET